MQPNAAPFEDPVSAASAKPSPSLSTPSEHSTFKILPLDEVDDVLELLLEDAALLATLLDDDCAELDMAELDIAELDITELDIAELDEELAA